MDPHLLLISISILYNLRRQGEYINNIERSEREPEPNFMRTTHVSDDQVRCIKMRICDKLRCSLWIKPNTDSLQPI